ncbi:MAG: beta-propeller fold lactonase family protein [Lachnospiraceae bacterium]|nr:beta-propeller fold lactonase family protein [Lachnospiraceae bacterium]
MAEKFLAYAGTYTHETSVGIHVYDIDMEKGSLIERSVAEINNPSYLTFSKDGRFLYSIADEGVASFNIDDNGDLTKASQKPIGGMRGCFVEVDSQNRFLFVGGYHDGRVTMMRLNEDGTIDGIADGLFHRGIAYTARDRRIDHPMVSCVKLTRDEKYLLAVDHGLSQVKVYRINYETGKLKLVHIIRCILDSAPRTVRFSHDGRFCYILDETANMIEVYTYEDAEGEPKFERIQKISVLDRKYKMYTEASCMCQSFDGQYMFVSVEGYNGMSILKRDAETGMLSFEHLTKISGDFPKSLTALPNNEYVAVVNHDSNEIRTFQVFHGERPHVVQRTAPVKVAQPNCIRVLKLER